jgi:hypothetical protein
LDVADRIIQLEDGQLCADPGEWRLINRH